MVKRFLSLIILLAMLLSAACATQQNYASAVSSWQGANQEQLYHTWGYPDKMDKLPNGHRLLIYRSRQAGRNPVYQTPGSTTIVQGANGNTEVISTAGSISGGGTYDLRCTTWFELGPKGNIVNTSFRGNNCVATKNDMLLHTYQG